MDPMLADQTGARTNRANSINIMAMDPSRGGQPLSLAALIRPPRPARTMQPEESLSHGVALMLAESGQVIGTWATAVCGHMP